MMDISADDLTNKNLYDYCHAEDLQKLRKAHIDRKITYKSIVSISYIFKEKYCLPNWRPFTFTFK